MTGDTAGSGPGDHAGAIPVEDWGRRFLETSMVLAGHAVVPATWVDHGLRWTLQAAGVLAIEPEDSGASIVISAAVHGNETAPAEMLDAIVADLAGGRLALRQRLLVIIGNPPAVVAGRRFVDENLNRLFSGRHEGKDHPEAHRAAELERLVTRFLDDGPVGHRRLHYELHTAIRASQLERFVIHPHGQALADDQLDLLRRADVHAVLFANQPASTFSYFSSHSCRAESMTIELGRVSPLGQNDPSRLEAIDACLRAVLGGTPLPPVRSEPIRFDVERELVRTGAEPFTFHVDDAVANFTLLEPGRPIISDADGDLVIEGEGRRIVFPNPDVPVGQRVGLVVKPAS